MKIIKYILSAVIFGLALTSCYDLSLEPKGQLGEAELFGNEYGVGKYFVHLYMYLPIEDFNYYSNNGYRPDNYWEAYKNSLGQATGELINTWTRVRNDGANYWPYDRIREVNSFIENFPKYKDNYTDESYNRLLGEARFLRAFFYFGMVKRYGGVPIVTEVQDPTQPLETLQPPRSSEYDAWKFIYDDLKFAMDNMADDPEKKLPGRANKYTAAALLSRTMVYAGSIARYSQYLGFETEEAYIRGFVGIDPSKANEFFQYAYDAGNLIINSGQYALYNKYPNDPATNYAQLFLDADSPENIFVKAFDNYAPHDARLRHTYDAMMSPSPDMSSFVGSQGYPSLDFMQMFDFPTITADDGKPVRFDRRSDIREGMEPRLRGICYFDGDELRGHTFGIQRGVYKTFPWEASAAGNGENSQPANINDNRLLGYDRGATTTIDGKVIRLNGDHGLFENYGGENNPITGAFIRKYVDPTLPTDRVRDYSSFTDWIVFRMGEIYLNTAEAAYELDKKQEAFNSYIRPLRERAGSLDTNPYKAAPADLSQIYGYAIDENLQFIRDERYRELAFENHRWWDLRRWRTADRVLSNWIPRVLMCYYVADEDKYIYLDERERWNQSWNAEKNCYYQGIDGGEINKNPNLLPKNPLR